MDMTVFLAKFRRAVRGGGLWLQEIGLQQKWTNSGAPQEGTRLFLDGPTARRGPQPYAESKGAVSAGSAL
jgi:hypothetical protein